MKTIQERALNLIKNKEFQILIIGLIIGVVAYALPENIIRPDLDKSWEYALNYFFINNLEYGKDILWPYGPLSFLLFPMPLWTYKYTAIFYFSLSFFFCYFSTRLFYEAKGNFKFIIPVALASVYIFASFSSFLEQTMFIPVMTLLLHYVTKKKRWYYLTCILSAISFMLKTGLGAINAVALFVYTIYLICSKLFELKSDMQNSEKKEIFSQTLNIFKTAVSGCILYFGILIFIWLIFYHNISGLFNYIFWQVNLSFGYTHTLFYVFNVNYSLLVVAVILFMIIPLFFGSKEIRVFHIIMTSVILLFIKYSMVRHLSYIFPFLYVTGGLYLFFTKRITKLALCYFAVIILFSVPFSTRSNVISYFQYIKKEIIEPKGVANVFYELWQPNASVENAQMVSGFTAGHSMLSDKAKVYLNNYSVDIYPFENTFVYTNNLNWTPRFLFHGYMTYTPELDKKNVEFLSSDKAPDYILWHKTLIDFDSDFAKRGVLSFDRKYLFNDDPQTMQAFLKYYGDIKDFKNVFILKKLESPLDIEEKVSENFTFKYNEWISVPQKENDITLLSLKFNYTPYGKITGIIGESVWAYVDYEFFDNTFTRYKLSSIDNLEAGMWVNPHIWEIKDNFKTRKVKRIRIVVDNPKTLENKIEGKWIFMKKLPEMWLNTDFSDDTMLNNIHNYSNLLTEDKLSIKKEEKNIKKIISKKDVTLKENTKYILKVQGTAYDRAVLYPKIAAARVLTNCNSKGYDFMLISDNHLHEYNLILNNQGECKLKQVILNINDKSVRLKDNFKFKLFEIGK